MITWIRTATALPGKTGEAVAFAKEIAGPVKRVVGRDVTVSTAFGGPLAAIAWIAHYDNAGQVEEANAKLAADREYQTILAKAHGLFVPGSGHDQMWRQV